MRARERGATAVVVAVVLALLCGFVALSLDVGHLHSVRGELQNGADASALAAVRRLDGTVGELGGAIDDARVFARFHPTDIYDVEPTTIELGAWLRDDADHPCPTGSSVTAREYGYKFCAIPGRSDADAAQITAVRVVTERTGAPGATGGGDVELAFGAFLGRTQGSVRAEAIAVSGGPCNQGEGCPELPFAVKLSCIASGGIPDCDSSEPLLFYVGSANSNVDTAGMTGFQEVSCGDGGGSGTGTPDICAVLDDDCGQHPEVGECIVIKNGNNIRGNCAHTDPAGKMCELILQKVGQIAQVPLIEYVDGESCSGGFSDFNYNQSATIARFGSVRLVGGQCKQGGNITTAVAPGYDWVMPGCLDDDRSFSADSCFVLQFVCDQTDDDVTEVGCAWAGTSIQQPVIVQ